MKREVKPSRNNSFEGKRDDADAKRNNSFEAKDSPKSAKAMGSVAAAASSFEAKSRSNSIENSNKTEVQQAPIKTNETKKEKAVPPPRKSSDPSHHVIPPISNQTKTIDTPIDKPEPTKQKAANGSIPHVETQKPQSPVISPPQPKKEDKLDSEGQESNGVGDKIRQFEKAAGDATTTGRISRTGSVRSKMSDRVNPVSSTAPQQTDKPTTQVVEKVFSPPTFAKWRKEDPGTPIATLKSASVKIQDKDIKPNIKFNKFPQDLPTKSAAIGAQSVDRDVTSPPQHRNIETGNSNNHIKMSYKAKAPKQPAYFSRGTEEIWMVKKKDIEEIEDRVLESFRRAGRSQQEAVREFPFTSGASTLGRGKRGVYARSESLDPTQAAGRAHTLKRQSSVACTCAHEKKNRSKSGVPGGTTPLQDVSSARARSRSHGDDNSDQILDKYETLV